MYIVHKFIVQYTLFLYLKIDIDKLNISIYTLDMETVPQKLFYYMLAEPILINDPYMLREGQNYQRRELYFEEKNLEFVISYGYGYIIISRM